ncbi:MAG: phosphoribosylformylglycinamidine cyclo-ligase [Dehalococcoidia bacterium]|nr:MAG: phosphoribosylformylglycinamidine cyclo-ligase [Dehalococcoidia bacterium]
MAIALRYPECYDGSGLFPRFSSGSKTTSQYAKAGVDIGAKNISNRLIGKVAATTYRPEVLSDVGFFSGMYDFKGYRNPVLVSSTDSVGTKVKIAVALGKYDTVGVDIVNHCINDIFTCGASPIFFLDYIGIGKLVPERVEAIVRGLANACREANCALIGGETAEMSDLYHGNDFDLAGFIVGVVEKEEIISGKKIKAGDAILGLASSGLHTNGYTLARKIFGETKTALKKRYPELDKPIGEVLLEPHRSYYGKLKSHLSLIKGLAHITGGGFPDNVPRILPEGLAARFNSRLWEVPPVFKLMELLGNVSRDEMYHVFNMGIGMVVVSSPENVGKIEREIPEIKVIGEVAKEKGGTRVTID